ncbi:hypothetical protein [Symbioplanes lichenis]|uniref:hypothetical protein n=1 Tax=Symbioplanes lichenis TaxID=1629072 RepID=UPI002739DCD3|nr:hypothetical protein [Actinoplanes lichenis]
MISRRVTFSAVVLLTPGGCAGPSAADLAPSRHDRIPHAAKRIHDAGIRAHA